nr:glycosyltransferase [Anaerolineales bacterium]MBP6210909.1 glycosyltransferase [Anaerolineales bacterium]
ESMLRLLLKKGVSAQKGILFPNWVDTKSVFPRSDDNLRDELSITSDQLVVLYSGSMGAKQGLEILVEVARQLESHREIVFVLCGEGPVRNELIDRARDLPNVRFLPLQPMDKLNPLLNTADIHILPQKADVADLVMPSKLLGMLASGKTIIATAMPETEIGRVVGRVGVLVPPGNSAALCEAILGLSKSTEQLKYLGESGRSYVCDNWGKDMVLQKFLKQMDDLLQKGN